ncbi:MAG: GntR family transcriptional regulator, partial [Anaerolineae bacterium]|nr:GntR family transcriptional regulator [Anaerolineae bacterium]
MTFSQIRALNLREQVADQIRSAIIEGRLRPEDHITEVMLSEQLGVSRTPVREALILLEREELVVSIPNRGFFVRSFDERVVSELFSMRTILENFAADLLVDRLTPEDDSRLTQLIEQQAFYLVQDDFKQVRRADMAFH